MSTLLFYPGRETYLASMLKDEFTFIFLKDPVEIKEYEEFVKTLLIDLSAEWNGGMKFLEKLEKEDIYVIVYGEIDISQEEILIGKGVKRVLKTGFSKQIIVKMIKEVNQKKDEVSHLAQKELFKPLLGNSSEQQVISLDKGMLKSFAELLSVSPSLGKLLEIFLKILGNLLKVSRIGVFLEEEDRLVLKGASGIPVGLVNKWFLRKDSILPSVLQKEGAVVSAIAREDLDDAFFNIGLKHAVPIFKQGRLIGIIGFNNKISGTPITEVELEMVYTLGFQLGVAIENIKLLELIKHQKSYLEDILKNVSSGIISVDEEGKIVSFNPAAEEIYEKDLEKYIGKDIEEVSSVLKNMVQQVLNGGVPLLRQEVKVEEVDKVIGVSIAPIQGRVHRISGAVIVFDDLTSVKIMEEERLKLEKMEFVGLVARRSSHEFKNCLVSIKTFAQLLPQRYQDPSFREDFYKVVNREVDRLNNVIENILFFAQPIELKYSLCKIREMVEEVIYALLQEEELDGIQIHKEFFHRKEGIYIDRNGIKRVLKALLSNSIQVMPEGGNIWITTEDIVEDDSEYLKIIVKDDGLGISSEDISRIWEPFFTTKAKGIGLGLTIVQKIVEAHKGYIRVSSRVGEGTEFVVYLPYIKSLESLRTGWIYTTTG